MKKSDFGVVTLIYAFCLFFFYQVYLLPEETQYYPSFLLAAIFLLNTLYLAKALFSWLKEHKVTDDMAHLFDGFVARQFWMVVAGCLIYVFMLYTLGYYIASVIYMVAALALLKVNTKYIGMVLVILMIVIYLVFSLFLKVPLPAGMLFD